MTICVIQGSPVKTGNGNSLYQRVKKNLKKDDPDTIFEEFQLHTQFNEFCTGCYTCFLKSEKKCPHHSKWEPIVDSLLNADGVIFLSPSYVLGTSGQMKAFLDHLGWLFIPHRPDPRMFNKPGFIISTAAGAGTKEAIKCIKRSFKFWGSPKIISGGYNLHALDVNTIDEKRKRKIDLSLKKKTGQFKSTIKKKKHTNLFRSIIFLAMKNLIKGYEEENIDKQYWLKQGWLN